MPNEIRTFSSTIHLEALYTLASKPSYECLDSVITKTNNRPFNLENCLNNQKFQLGPENLTSPSKKWIAENIIGITADKDLWVGSSTVKGWTAEGTNILNSLYFETASKEMFLVRNSRTEPNDVSIAPLPGPTYRNLSKEFVGCYFTSPEAPFSANCPEIGNYYPWYLKLRLNVATFWNTPKQTPVKRREFLDSFKYARKAELVISGDFNVKIGDVIELKLNSLSGYGNANTDSVLNGFYWVIGRKHVFTNSGTHETHLRVTQMMPTVYSNSVF